jgi:hypothetical protein
VGRPGEPELLRFLQRSLRSCAVVVLGTYRDGEVEQGGPLAAVLEKMAGAGATLHLTGLGPAEVEAMAAARGASAGDVQLLHTRSGGNPFLVEQLCDLGDLSSAAPPAVAALLQGRLRTLTDECRELLEVAAVPVAPSTCPWPPTSSAVRSARCRPAWTRRSRPGAPAPTLRRPAASSRTT